MTIQTLKDISGLVGEPVAASWRRGIGWTITCGYIVSKAWSFQTAVMKAYSEAMATGRAAI